MIRKTKVRWVRSEVAKVAQWLFDHDLALAPASIREAQDAVLEPSRRRFVVTMSAVPPELRHCLAELRSAVPQRPKQEQQALLAEAPQVPSTGILEQLVFELQALRKELADFRAEFNMENVKLDDGSPIVNSLDSTWPPSDLPTKVQLKKVVIVAANNDQFRSICKEHEGRFRLVQAFDCTQSGLAAKLESADMVISLTKFIPHKTEATIKEALRRNPGLIYRRVNGGATDVVRTLHLMASDQN